MFTSLPQVVISGALCSQDFIYSAQCKDSTAVHVSETGKVRLMELSKVQRKYNTHISSCSHSYYSASLSLNSLS